MGDPTIVIAGKQWCVPLLAPRQNRIVVPALMLLGARAEKQYELLLDIVFAALTRASPAIAREEFEDWPVATHELVEALPVIAKQTGLCWKRNPAPAQAGTSASNPPDWDAIIAEVVNFLPGTTPDYWEDALTTPRLEALREQWRLHPPPALLLAAFLGYRPKPRDEDAVAELLRLFPTGALKLN
ncbi:MAG TPA: hypothetical protein VHT03_01560 [Rhizomicrobium sp.]|jgi:hypothetical protein|nr:hypothetical protein [Rhizomicrobium sp.]